MSYPACPNCQSEYVYQEQQLLICPECAFEWDPKIALLLLKTLMALYCVKAIKLPLLKI